MAFLFLDKMEEGIYRMSFVESILVLIVVGLWLLAVIHLARKLERICNPPSIFPNYSLHNKTSLSPLPRADRYSKDSIQSTISSPINFVRSTSEPAIDASPRATIHIRSPSETCLHTKSTIVQHLSSPSTLELGQSIMNNSHSLVNLSRHSGYRIHVKATSSNRIPSHKLLNPKRIPSIVRRSLLDLHRRALYLNSSTDISPLQCIVKTTGNQLTTTKIPLIKKTYQRANAVDNDDSV
jgi:hypothetical protein